MTTPTSSHRIEKLGKHTYALGLEWIAVSEGIKEGLAYLDDQGQSIYYIALTPKGGAPTLGYVRGTIKGRVASFAATLATVAGDGIYAAELEGGRWWYCVLSSGQVVASTDREMSEAEARETIETMRATFGLEVYASGAIVHDARPFDPVASVAKAKPQWLRRRGTSPQELVLAAVIVAVAVPGFWWAWRTVMPKEATYSGPTPEEIRAAYIDTVRSSLPTIPENPTWVVDAFGAGRYRFPPFRAGWSLDRMSCDPAGGCVGAYVPMQNGIWRSHEKLGATGTNLDAANVTMPLSEPLRTFTDQEILAYPDRHRPIVEVLGQFGLRFASGRLDGAPQITEFGPALLPDVPPEAQAWSMERFVIGDTTVLNDTTLRNVVAYFIADGFVPISIQSSAGYGDESSGWKIDFIRLQGVEQ